MTIYHETSQWIVHLHENQAYLGYSIIEHKDAAKHLRDVGAAAWSELHELIRTLENAWTDAYGATSFNWSCLMNDAYKYDPPNPQVHWHMRPRYREPVTIDSRTFIDTEFAHHYDKTREDLTDKAMREAILSRLNLA